MISSKLPNVAASIFSTMSALAKKHRALNLSQGFPSFKVDPILKELHTKAIKDDHNQYAPMAGLPLLREVMAIKTQELHGASYSPNNEICITAGATQAIFTALQASIHRGDEVIVFTPAYDCYIPAIELAGGTAVEIEMTLPDFSIDWSQVENHISDQTKMILINSPHNPSGKLLSHEDMMELERIVQKHDLLLLSDEVYEHMTYDGKPHLSASRYEGLKNRSFIVGSYGKTFHITGWKIGYCLAPQHLMEEFYKVHQYLVFCVSHPAQVAIANYLQEKNHYLNLPDFYKRKRDLFLNSLQNSKFTFTPTEGSYFQLLNYSDITNESDADFAKRLTIEHKIASIPISVFMKGVDPKMLRFCFAKEDSELIEAAQILKRL